MMGATHMHPHSKSFYFPCFGGFVEKLVEIPDAVYY